MRARNVWAALVVGIADVLVLLLWLSAYFAVGGQPSSDLSATLALGIAGLAGLGAFVYSLIAIRVRHGEGRMAIRRLSSLAAATGLIAVGLVCWLAVLTWNQRPL